MPAAPNGAGGGQGCAADGWSIARVGGKVSGWGLRGGGFAPQYGRSRMLSLAPKAVGKRRIDLSEVTNLKLPANLSTGSWLESTITG